jgi:hypothetical protein
MKKFWIVSLLGLTVTFAVPALAQTPDTPKAPLDSENGRFNMSPVADGVMRLDTRTGQISLCRKRNDNWTCESVADDRAAYEKEIGRLQGQVGALESQLGRGPNKQTELKLPSDAEVDRVMKFFENIFRRFMGMIENLQREKQEKGT